MNLFELFRDATLTYMAANGTPNRVTPQLDARLRNVVLPEIQQSYFNATSPDYSGLERRLAYCLHLAPRHAVIWRHYVRKSESFLLEKSKLNSIGTGPGSEVIGILAACEHHPGSIVEVVCLEREATWREMFECVVNEFNRRSSFELVATFTDDPDNLIPGAPVVGSCVLSELGRERRITSFYEVVGKTVGQV